MSNIEIENETISGRVPVFKVEPNENIESIVLNEIRVDDKRTNVSMNETALRFLRKKTLVDNINESTTAVYNLDDLTYDIVDDKGESQTDGSTNPDITPIPQDEMSADKIRKYSNSVYTSDIKSDKSNQMIEIHPVYNDALNKKVINVQNNLTAQNENKQQIIHANLSGLKYTDGSTYITNSELRLTGTDINSNPDDTTSNNGYAIVSEYRPVDVPNADSNVQNGNIDKNLYPDTCFNIIAQSLINNYFIDPNLIYNGYCLFPGDKIKQDSEISIQSFYILNDPSLLNNLTEITPYSIIKIIQNSSDTNQESSNLNNYHYVSISTYPKTDDVECEFKPEIEIINDNQSIKKYSIRNINDNLPLDNKMNYTLNEVDGIYKLNTDFTVPNNMILIAFMGSNICVEPCPLSNGSDYWKYVYLPNYVLLNAKTINDNPKDLDNIQLITNYTKPNKETEIVRHKINNFNIYANDLITQAIYRPNNQKTYSANKTESGSIIVDCNITAVKPYDNYTINIKDKSEQTISQQIDRKFNTQYTSGIESTPMYIPFNDLLFNSASDITIKSGSVINGIQYDTDYVSTLFDSTSENLNHEPFSYIKSGTILNKNSKIYAPCILELQSDISGINIRVSPGSILCKTSTVNNQTVKTYETITEMKIVNKIGAESQLYPGSDFNTVLENVSCKVLKIGNNEDNIPLLGHCTIISNSFSGQINGKLYNNSNINNSNVNYITTNDTLADGCIINGISITNQLISPIVVDTKTIFKYKNENNIKNINSINSDLSSLSNYIGYYNNQPIYNLKCKVEDNYEAYVRNSNDLLSDEYSSIRDGTASDDLKNKHSTELNDLSNTENKLPIEYYSDNIILSEPGYNHEYYTNDDDIDNYYGGKRFEGTTTYTGDEVFLKPTDVLGPSTELYGYEKPFVVPKDHIYVIDKIEYNTSINVKDQSLYTLKYTDYTLLNGFTDNDFVEIPERLKDTNIMKYIPNNNTNKPIYEEVKYGFVLDRDLVFANDTIFNEASDITYNPIINPESISDSTVLLAGSQVYVNSNNEVKFMNDGTYQPEYIEMLYGTLNTFSKVYVGYQNTIEIFYDTIDDGEYFVGKGTVISFTGKAKNNSKILPNNKGLSENFDYTLNYIDIEYIVPYDICRIQISTHLETDKLIVIINNEYTYEINPDIPINFNGIVSTRYNFVHETLIDNKPIYFIHSLTPIYYNISKTRKPYTNEIFNSIVQNNMYVVDENNTSHNLDISSYINGVLIKKDSFIASGSKINIGNMCYEGNNNLVNVSNKNITFKCISDKLCKIVYNKNNIKTIKELKYNEIFTENSNNLIYYETFGLYITMTPSYYLDNNSDNDLTKYIHAKQTKNSFDSHFQFKIHKNDKLGLYSTYIDNNNPINSNQPKTLINKNDKIYWNGQIKTEKIIDANSLYNVSINSQTNDSTITYTDSKITNISVGNISKSIVYKNNGDITFGDSNLCRIENKNDLVDVILIIKHGNYFYGYDTISDIDQLINPKAIQTITTKLDLKDYTGAIQLFKDDITLNNQKILSSNVLLYESTYNYNVTDLKIDKHPLNYIKLGYYELDNFKVNNTIKYLINNVKIPIQTVNYYDNNSTVIIKGSYMKKCNYIGVRWIGVIDDNTNNYNYNFNDDTKYIELEYPIPSYLIVDNDNFIDGTGFYFIGNSDLAENRKQNIINEIIIPAGNFEIGAGATLTEIKLFGLWNGNNLIGVSYNDNGSDNYKPIYVTKENYNKFITSNSFTIGGGMNSGIVDIEINFGFGTLKYYVFATCESYPYTTTTRLYKIIITIWLSDSLERKFKGEEPLTTDFNHEFKNIYNDNKNKFTIKNNKVDIIDYETNVTVRQDTYTELNLNYSTFNQSYYFSMYDTPVGYVPELHISFGDVDDYELSLSVPYVPIVTLNKNPTINTKMKDSTIRTIIPNDIASDYFKYKLNNDSSSNYNEYDNMKNFDSFSVFNDTNHQYPVYGYENKNITYVYNDPYGKSDYNLGENTYVRYYYINEDDYYCSEYDIADVYDFNYNTYLNKQTDLSYVTINYTPITNDKNTYVLTIKDKISQNKENIKMIHLLPNTTIEDLKLYLPDASNVESSITLLEQTYTYKYEDLNCIITYNSSDNTWSYNSKTKSNPEYGKFIKINKYNDNYYLNQFYVYNVDKLSFNLNISVDYDLICKVINYGINNDNTFHVNEITETKKFDVLPFNELITIRYAPGSIINSEYLSTVGSDNEITLQTNNNYPVFIKSGSIINNEEIYDDSYITINNTGENIILINGYHIKNYSTINAGSRLNVYSTIGNEKLMYIGSEQKIKGNWKIDDTIYNKDSIIDGKYISDGSILAPTTDDKVIDAAVHSDLYDINNISIAVTSHIKVNSKINNITYDSSLCDEYGTVLPENFDRVIFQYDSTLTAGSSISDKSIINGIMYSDENNPFITIKEPITVKPYVELYGVLTINSIIKSGSIINGITYTIDTTITENIYLQYNDIIKEGSKIARNSMFVVNEQIYYVSSEETLDTDFTIINTPVKIQSYLEPYSIIKEGSVVNDITYTEDYTTIINQNNSSYEFIKLLVPSYISTGSEIIFTVNKDALLTGKLFIVRASNFKIGDNKLIIPDSYFETTEDINLTNNEYKYSIVMPLNTQEYYPYYSRTIPIIFEPVGTNTNDESIKLKTFIDNKYITFINSAENKIIPSDIIDSVIDEEHSQMLLTVPIKMALDSKINEYRYNIIFENIYPTIEYSNNLNYMKLYKTGDFHLYYDEASNQVQLSKNDSPIEATSNILSESGNSYYLIGYIDDDKFVGYPDNFFYTYTFSNTKQAYVYNNTSENTAASLYTYLITYYSQNDLRFKIQKDISFDPFSNSFNNKPYEVILTELGDQGNIKVMGTSQNYYTNTLISYDKTENEDTDIKYEVNKGIRDIDMTYDIIPTLANVSNTKKLYDINNNEYTPCMKVNNNETITYNTVDNTKCKLQIHFTATTSKITLNIKSIENTIENIKYQLGYKNNNNDFTPLNYNVEITKTIEGYPYVKIKDIMNQESIYTIQTVKQNENYFISIVAKYNNKTYLYAETQNNQSIITSLNKWIEVNNLYAVPDNYNILHYSQLTSHSNILIVKNMDFTDIVNSVIINIPIYESLQTFEIVNYSNSSTLSTTTWHCDTFNNISQTDEYVFTMKGCTFPHIITLQNVDYILKYYKTENNDEIYILDKLDEYNPTNPTINVPLTTSQQTTTNHDIYMSVNDITDKVFRRENISGNISGNNNSNDIPNNYLITKVNTHIQTDVYNKITLTSNDIISCQYNNTKFIYKLTDITYNSILDSDKNTLTIIIHANQSLTLEGSDDNLLSLTTYIYKNTILLDSSITKYNVGAIGNEYSQPTDNSNFQFNIGEFNINNEKYQFSVLSGISKLDLGQAIINSLYTFTLDTIYSQCKFDSINKLTSNIYKYNEISSSTFDYTYNNIGIIKSYKSENPSNFYIVTGNDVSNASKSLYALTYPISNSENSTTLLASNVREISELNIPIQYGFKDVQMGLQTSSINDSGNDSIILKESILTKYDIINNMTLNELLQSKYKSFITSINDESYKVVDNIVITNYTKLCHKTNNSDELIIYMCENANTVDKTGIRDKHVVYLKTYADIAKFTVTNDIVLNTDGGYCVFKEFDSKPKDSTYTDDLLINSNNYLSIDTNYNSFELNNIIYNKLIESNQLFEDQYSSKNNILNNESNPTNAIYVYNGRILVNSPDTITQFIQNYTNTYLGINILSDAMKSNSDTPQSNETPYGVFRINETKIKSINNDVVIPQYIRINDRMLVTIEIGVNKIPENEGGNGYRIIYDCLKNNLQNNDFKAIFTNPNTSFTWENTYIPKEKSYTESSTTIRTTIHAYQFNSTNWNTYNPIILQWKHTDEPATTGGWDSSILYDNNNNNYKIGVHGNDCIVRFAHMIAHKGEGNYKHKFVIDMNMTQKTIETLFNINQIIKLAESNNVKYAHFYYSRTTESNITTSNNYYLSYPENWTIDEIMLGIYNKSSLFSDINPSFTKTFEYVLFMNFDTNYVDYSSYNSASASLGNYVYVFPCNQTEYEYAVRNTENRDNTLQIFDIYTKRNGYPSGLDWKFTASKYKIKYAVKGYNNNVGNGKNDKSYYTLDKIPLDLWNNTYVKEIKVCGLALIKNCKFDKILVSPIPNTIYTIDKISINNDLKQRKTDYQPINAFESIGVYKTDDIIIDDKKIENILPYDTNKWYDYGNFDDREITYNSDVFNAWKTSFNTILSPAVIYKDEDTGEYKIEPNIDNPDAKINRIKIAKEYGNELLATEILVSPGSLINSKIQTTTAKLKLNNLLSNTITYRTIDKGDNMIYITGNQNIAYNNNDYGVICINSNAEEDETTAYLNVEHFNINDLASIAFDQFETNVNAGSRIGPGQYNINEYYEIEGDNKVEYNTNEIHFPVGSVCNFSQVGSVIRYQCIDNNGTFVIYNDENDENNGNIGVNMNVQTVYNEHYNEKMYIIYTKVNNSEDEYQYRLCINKRKYYLIDNTCYINGYDYDYWSKFMISILDSNGINFINYKPFNIQYLTTISKNNTENIDNLITSPIIPKSSIIVKGSIINDKLINEDRYIDETIIINNYTAILKGSKISGNMYYIGDENNLYNGYTDTEYNIPITYDIIIPAYLTAYSGVHVDNKGTAENPDYSSSTTIYPILQAGSKILMNDLINLQEYITTKFDLPDLTTNNILFNYNFINTRTNAYDIVGTTQTLISIKDAVETKKYPHYSINIKFELALSVNDLKLIGKRIINTNQYFISLYPKCKVYYPGLCHIEELNCANKLEPINIIVELADINEAIVRYDYPNNTIDDKVYTFNKMNRILQFFTSDYTQLNNVLSDFMSCCGFTYSITPKYSNIARSSLKTKPESHPFKTVIHEVVNSKYKYNIVSSKVYEYISGPSTDPQTGKQIINVRDENQQELTISMDEVEYYNNTNVLRQLGVYTSTLSDPKITDDTTQICFKFYTDNTNGLEFLRIKMDLCDFICCNNMFNVVETNNTVKYTLHVQSLKKYIDYYLNGQIIHDRNNHTEIYAYYKLNSTDTENTLKKEFFLHNPEKYYYIRMNDYINSTDISNISNEHIYANNPDVNRKYYETENTYENSENKSRITVINTDIDTSKLTNDLIASAHAMYQPTKISSYEMISELFNRFSSGYFKIDILHQYYDNQATNGLYYDSVISYATSATYFQYINYELNSQNIRQYVSYPNSYPIDERKAFQRIDNTNYDNTIETKFNYRDCENCTTQCCDFGINSIDNNTIDNDKYYHGKLYSNTGSISLYRGNLKISAIYITTMLPLYKDKNNEFTNVDLNYGVINFIDAQTKEILQTTSYTCEIPETNSNSETNTNNSTSKEYNIKLTCKSGDINETYNTTAQISYVIEDETDKVILYAGSIIGANSIINNERYTDKTLLEDNIEIKTYTKLDSTTIIKLSNGTYIDLSKEPSYAQLYNTDTGNYPNAQLKLFNGEDVEERNIQFNYIPDKCYVTFAVPILVDGHQFDYTNQFIVQIDKILCTYDLLSFNIAQMPDEYRSTNIYISNESYMNYEETNMNNTYLIPGSTIAKESIINNSGKNITITENTKIESILHAPLEITKGSIINSETIRVLQLGDETLTYQYKLGENTNIAVGSMFIIDAREGKTKFDTLGNYTNFNLYDAEGEPYNINNPKDYYICSLKTTAPVRLAMTIYLASKEESGITSDILGKNDYIFAADTTLYESILGFTVYQGAYLHEAITGTITDTIKLDTSMINRILAGSTVGKGTKLNYTTYNENTKLENPVIVSNKVSIPAESVLAPGTVLLPGSMLNGKTIDELEYPNGYMIDESTEIIKVSEDSNYYLDTIYVDTDKYNTVEDLIKALNNNFKTDIYNNLNKYDEDVVFKNIVYINYETPKLLSLYDSDDNLYNIVIDWDSWDFKNMTASLTSGKKIYIYSIKNDGKNTVSRVVTVVSLDSENSESKEPQQIKFNFSDTTRSSWDLLQYQQTYDFIYSYRYDTAIPIQFKDMYDDEIINDELIDDTIVKDGDFIKVSKIGEQYIYTFATDIIPVEFTEDDIPNEMNYLNLVRKFQNYEKYIDENADKMLIYPVIEKIVGSYVNNPKLTDYIKDYINAEKYFINFKQNQRSLWHKLGISPILINKENRPIIKINSDENEINSISGSENLNYVLENDLYDSFSEIVYYHYLGSYFTETVYNSDWLKLSHRFIDNKNKLPTGSVNIYDKGDEVADGISRFNLWSNIWRNDRKPDLNVPLTFMLKLSHYEDVEKVLNLASNNNNVIYSIDEQNITKDDNGDLVLSIYKTIDLNTSDPFYIYLDAKTHYPFERGVNAILSVDYNVSASGNN